MNEQPKYFHHILPVKTGENTFTQVPIKTCFIEHIESEYLEEYKKTFSINLHETANLNHWWLTVELYFLLMHNQGDSFFMPGTLDRIVDTLETKSDQGEDVLHFIEAALTWPVFQGYDGYTGWDQAATEVKQRLDDLRSKTT